MALQYVKIRLTQFIINFINTFKNKYAYRKLVS